MNYQPGDKLVLEIKHYSGITKPPSGDVNMYAVQGTKMLFPENMLDNFASIDSDYINEHYGDLQDEAYQQGMDEAWELARKISMNDRDGGIPTRDLLEIFQEGSVSKIYENNTAHQAKSKIEAWEKAKAEIKVGDVVEYELAGEALVIHIGKYETCTLLNSKTLYTGVVMRCLTKTGRTIDIQSVLAQIGGAV